MYKKICYVYIMSNRTRVLYTGITNDLGRRVAEHKSRKFPGFTRKYNITRLVWFEEFDSINEAIECEKRIKGWRREKNKVMIEEMNPEWKDLAEETQED